MHGDAPRGWLDDVARRHPDATALVADGLTVTYAELAAAAAERTGIEVVEPRLDVDSVAALWGAWRGDGTVLVVDPRDPGRLRAPEPGAVPAGVHTLVPTSGSTGAARLAILTDDNVAAAVSASRQRLGNGPDDRWLLVLPLFHVGGLSILWRSAAVGGTVVLHDRFDPARAAAELRAVSFASFVPTMLRRVLDVDPGPYEGTKVLLGGAACPPQLVDRAFSAGLVPLPTYGATEAASQIATVSPQRAWEDRRSVGRPLAGFDVRIDAPAGTAGEIVVDGPAVFAGYVGEPPRRGPHRTADLGRIDADGRLHVLGRADDMVVTGGENVHPGRIEDVVAAHPAVSEAAVVGIPDPEWGAIVGAAVVAGAALEPDALTGWCRERLRPAEVPRRWMRLRVLPYLATGKVDRAAIVRRFTDAPGPVAWHHGAATERGAERST